MASGDTLCIFKPQEAEWPGSNSATFEGQNFHPVVTFTQGTNDKVRFAGVMPQHYGGGGVTVYIHWASRGISGNVDWDVAFERIGDQQQDIDSDGFASVQSVDNTTVPGTAGNVDIVSIAFTDGAQMDSVAAGEGFRIEVTRDGTNDTSTSDAYIRFIEIRET